jgi:hypothetical protein
VRVKRNTLIQNEELLIVEAGGRYSYHWALKTILFQKKSEKNGDFTQSIPANTYCSSIHLTGRNTEVIENSVTYLTRILRHVQVAVRKNLFWFKFDIHSPFSSKKSYVKYLRVSLPLPSCSFQFIVHRHHKI